MEKIKGIDIQKDKYESEKKGLAIEIEIELEYDLSMCAGTMMHITEVLLTQQTKNKVIDGVYDISSEIINNEYEYLDNWVIKLRIIQKKRYVSVEILLEVHINVSAQTLYQ